MVFGVEQEEFSKRLSDCSDFADVFEMVKEGVEWTIGKGRAGLMLGIANLGGSNQQYIGAYYPVASNIIVMNSFPISMISKNQKELLNPYVFMVLTHEYLHSLGFLDEQTVRKMTLDICQKLFGTEHLTTQLAFDISKFFKSFSYSNFGWFPDKQPEIKIVEGFDKGHLTYVS